jgi:ketosteroid isomerase-like protein
MSDPRDPVDIAERLFAAIEAGDIDTVRDLYDPDVEVWHNTDRVAQRRDENLATLAWVHRHLSGVTYEDVRRSATDDGFVQRHVLSATNRAGRRIEVPACIVASVRDGRVTRLDEYLDSAALAAFTERAATTAE